MATFAGYLVGGITGAAIATLAVFLPVYLFVIVPGRYLRRHGEHPRLQGFIKGATAAAAGAIAAAAGAIAAAAGAGAIAAAAGAIAAAAGAIAGAAIVIGEQVISRPGSVIIALAALALLLQPKLKVPEPALVAIAAVVGVIAFS